MKSSRMFLPGALALVCLTVPVRAENWPHWRGPHFDGSSDEQGLPDDFSTTNGVKWASSLPGPSAATPAIWGDHVFVSSTDLRNKTLRALALDRRTGRELWNRELGSGYSQEEYSNFASPSPATDGERVYFLYGTGDLAALDFNGNPVWTRNLQKDYGPFAYLWTYSSSPTPAAGKLFIQVLHRNEPINGRGRKDGPNDSFLLALDPKTGKEQWRHIRPCDAVGESHEAYSTPVPLVSPDGAQTQMLVVGGDCITGHDVADGRELWRWGTWNPKRITHWRLVPSPVSGGGVALAVAPKGSPVYAFKTDARGTLTDKDIAWASADREVSSDVCTPLFYRGRFYVVNGDKKTIARVDPATGKADWIGDLGSRVKIESSPTGADGKVYFQDFRGDVFIVGTGDQFKLIRKIPMGDAGDDRLRASVAAAAGQLFIRTGRKLYCVGR